MRRIYWILGICLVLAACTPGNVSTPERGQAPTQSPPPTWSATASPSPLAKIPSLSPSDSPGTGACQPAPIAVPTRPAVIPRTNELDETTGLHMTGDVQQIDLPAYRLAVTGLVDHPLSLAYDDLRCMPRVTAVTPIVCSTFSDSATFSGVPLAHVLQLAGIRSEAARIELVGADGYTARVALDEALKAENYLAYEWQGKPLPILHGFPLRALLPSMAGFASVKWLVEIRVQ